MDWRGGAFGTFLKSDGHVDMGLQIEKVFIRRGSKCLYLKKCLNIDMSGKCFQLIISKFRRKYKGP